MMKFNQIVWLFLIIFKAYFASILCVIDSNHTDVDHENRFFVPCQTPNGEDGLCTEIQKCPVLMKAFTQSKAVNFIKASKCGPGNEDIFQFRVCCGKKSDFIDKILVEDITPEEVQCPETPYVDKTHIKSPLPNKCGKQKMIFSRIIGGTNAELGEFPWMARLQYKNSFGSLRFGCGGFLIHKKVVLTAAHCIHSIFAQNFGPLYQVQFGEHDTENIIDCYHNECAPEPIEIKISNVVIHPGYKKDSRSHEHDIALIFLKKYVPFSDYVRPICVLDRCIKSQHLYVTGWGSTETDMLSNVKLKTTVPRVSNEACQGIYSKVNKTISVYQTCAGSVGKDSCKGDSGGPLMVIGNKGKWYAEGITSYGIGCGNKYPGVYTFLPKYYNWIVDEINKFNDTQ